MSSKRKNNDEFDEKGATSKRKNRALKDETFQSIWAIIFFIVAVFFFLAAFNKGGVAGEKIFGGLSTLFGFGYYLLPLSFLFLGISFLRTSEHRVSILKILATFFFFISGLGLLTIIHQGLGGITGSFVSSPLISLFDVYVSTLFLCAIVIASLLVIFDTHLKRDWNLLFGGAGKKDRDIQDTEVKIKKPLADEDGEEKMPEEKPVSVASVLALGKKKKEEPEEEFISKERPVLTKGKPYVPPPLSLLENDRGKPGVGDIKANANIIKRTLQNFGIDVEMDEVTIGPTVTRYSMKPAEGVKLSRIVGLQDNLALALAAQSIRIEAPIPGKSLVGIEVPNSSKTTVGLGSMISGKEFSSSVKPLLVSIGKDVTGNPKFYDLSKMPHLLIAGTTGSGKSVTVHAILTSLLYRNSPEMLKFIMVDAKRVELTLYNKIPHLLTPVITDAKKTILALKWATKEMDRRYDILEKESVRDIHSYHKNIVEPALKKAKEGDELPETMPYIVVVIDELADLMQAYPRELEAAIVRLAQMSRAVGIHLILSTQRPSVNVITGLIKANIPTRIALKVGSQIDSRTIIDKAGAEKLVGQGDMLFVTQDQPDPSRIQSPYISEGEVKGVVKYLVDEYKDEINNTVEITSGDKQGESENNPIFDSSVLEGSSEDDDELYEEAKEIVLQAGKASTSYIQRKLRVGYARAARLMDILEERGIIGPADGSKPREVLGGAGKSASDQALDDEVF